MVRWSLLSLPPPALSLPLRTPLKLVDCAQTTCSLAFWQGRGAMLEYLLVSGVNDSPEAADDLATFVHARAEAFSSLDEARAAAGLPPVGGKARAARRPFVNLIPYNPTPAGDAFGYRSPSDAVVGAFHARLRDAHGVSTLVRWTSVAGRDAQGACGQLALAVGGQYPAAPRDRSLPSTGAEN